jgi:Fe2+ or Zn2+ uptake regulation protein
MEALDKKTGELYEGNMPFYQFRKHNFKMIELLVKESQVGARLFMFLVNNMQEPQNALIVSQEALSEVLGVSRKTIYTAVKYLVDGKYIQVLKSGTNNVYCVNADIVWTKRAENLHCARFNASVYLTSNEQDQEEKLKIVKAFEKRIDIEKSFYQ